MGEPAAPLATRFQGDMEYRPPPGRNSFGTGTLRSSCRGRGLKQLRQVVENGRHRRMVRPVALLVDRQRAAIQRLRLLQPVRGPQQLRQVARVASRDSVWRGVSSSIGKKLYTGPYALGFPTSPRAPA